MKRVLTGLTLGFFLALFPLIAYADDGNRDNFTLRVNGDVTVPGDETLDTLVVINGDAEVDGKVNKALVVIRGNATVRGTVEGSVTVIDGDLNLEGRSTVEDVNVIRGDLNQAAGATITGDVDRSDFSFRGAWIWFSILFWVGATVFIIGAGLLFAAIGGRQLSTAAEDLTSRASYTVLGAVVIWIGLPILAFLFFVTVVGIPIGLAIILLGLPALWVLGYITTGTRLGAVMTGALGRSPGEHPYLAAALGLLILQIIVIVPVIGWLVATVAGLWGAGAIALVAYGAARGLTAGTGTSGPDTSPPPTTA